MTGGEPPLVPNSNESENNKTPSHESPEHKVADRKGGAGDKDGSDSEADGAEEILEESPCKRWSKRREKVKQRDVPGIDAAYLAMDNETGNEVVWNEVQFSERKNFREQEEKLKSVFHNLTQLAHVNLVKFHKYWTDSKSEKPRIIFITEYMSSGSMSRFLQRARSSGTLLNIKAWKKWATQILTALNYLHSCDPPIVHGNLTCNTIFIQQNGLLKIGCVAPNAIHHHVKTFRENIKNMHYVAPEWSQLTEATTQADIYSFGMCALEMATTGALQWGCSGNGDPKTESAAGGSIAATAAAVAAHQIITLEAIRKAVDSLEHPLQKDFIERCLNEEPEKRPCAHELLFHPVLFEVHSLKLVAAHAIVSSTLMEQLVEDDFRVKDKTRVVATSKWKLLSYADLPSFQNDLDKFLEDVKNGVYPLTAFASVLHHPTIANMSSKRQPLNASASMSGISGAADSFANDHSRLPPNPAPPAGAAADAAGRGESTAGDPSSVAALGGGGGMPSLQNGPINGPLNGPFNGQPSSVAGLGLSVSSAEKDEGYHTAQSTGGTTLPSVTAPAAGSTVASGESRHVVQVRATIVDNSSLQLLLQLDDQMNRQLTTELSHDDTAEGLVAELVRVGLISDVDSDRVCSVLKDTLEEWRRGREAEWTSREDAVATNHHQSPVPRPPTPSPAVSNGDGKGEKDGH